jgi:alkylation response protein AidB-like acyl-CoA dehydrogenase
LGHAASNIDAAHKQGADTPPDERVDFKGEVSMAKHFVAKMLGRVIDRAIQVHGALGSSTDMPVAHMYQHPRGLDPPRHRQPPESDPLISAASDDVEAAVTNVE